MSSLSSFSSRKQPQKYSLTAPPPLTFSLGSRTLALRMMIFSSLPRTAARRRRKPAEIYRWRSQSQTTKFRRNKRLIFAPRYRLKRDTSRLKNALKASRNSIKLLSLTPPVTKSWPAITNRSPDTLMFSDLSRAMTLISSRPRTTAF